VAAQPSHRKNYHRSRWDRRKRPHCSRARHPCPAPGPLQHECDPAVSPGRDGGLERPTQPPCWFC